MNAILRTTGLFIGMAAAWLGSGTTMAQSPGTTTAPTAKTATPTRQVDAATALFADWDTNHDKMLSPAEFAAGWQRLQAGMALRRLHEQFVAMDSSRDGCLDATEYKATVFLRVGKGASIEVSSTQSCSVSRAWAQMQLVQGA